MLTGDIGVPKKALVKEMMHTRRQTLSTECVAVVTRDSTMKLNRLYPVYMPPFRSMIDTKRAMSNPCSPMARSSGAASLKTARGSSASRPIQCRWKKRHTSLLADGLAGWSRWSCLAKTARALNPKFEAIVAAVAGMVPPASPDEARATPRTTGTSDAYVDARSTSLSRTYANTTVLIGSPDLMVSTKEAFASEKARFVKKKPSV
mmetsp:Transcript_12666/g.35863  ORF Transcript_12666/g.35863 Transcript_12666/m.35863 type:complete len:205 (+) Transcript_12666:95-709(+)